MADKYQNFQDINAKKEILDVWTHTNADNNFNISKIHHITKNF